jgi:hypothetical protein
MAGRGTGGFGVRGQQEGGRWYDWLGAASVVGVSLGVGGGYGCGGGWYMEPSCGRAGRVQIDERGSSATSS